MTWFKVDDRLAFNAKVMLAGNAAMGLWVRAGSWSSSQLTDGFVPEHMALAMANACDCDALVMAGLWNRIDGGYQFHDWADFQPTAQSEREKTQTRSNAGKRGAMARWGKQTNGKPDGKSHSSSHGKPDGKPDGKIMPRPDPSRPLSISNEIDTSSATKSGAYPDEFEAFWAVYPKRADKRQALKAWSAAIKRTDNAEIIAGARRYADDPNRVDEFTKNASTWLNADAWENGPLPPRTNVRQINRAQARLDNNLSVVRHFEEQEQADLLGGIES